MLIETLLILALTKLMAYIILGMERKIHARIQQRTGPPMATPGFWSILKFYNKKSPDIDSQSPKLYKATLVVTYLVCIFIILLSTPYWADILGFATFLGLIGLLKIEEASYLFMGALSQSVMSKSMPFPDTLKGAKTQGIRVFMEQISAVRSLKMITLGSFPFYVALLIPFAHAKSMYIQDAVSASLSNQYLSFGIGAIVYIVGYNILINNRPFDIIKPKVDIIEGGWMEYAAKWRAIAYLTRGTLMFGLSSLFISLYIGIPLSLDDPLMLSVHLMASLALPAIASVLKAFSPVLTFRQILPISYRISLIGLFAMILNQVGV